MSLPVQMTQLIDSALEAHAPELLELSRQIHKNPELRFEEHKAAGWISDLLRAHGYKVERGLANMETSLRVRAGTSMEDVPRIAILAEYDALPGIGHACGHNLIAAAGVGAFLGAASVVNQVNGEIVLLGTPAEEGGGGKIQLLDAGAFQGIDAAMMFHPFDRNLLAHPTLASLWITFEFQGVSSHAAVAPHEGKSALTACLDTFRLIDGQRVHFKDGVRVHGYITNGGQAVNIVPATAACEFSVRARDGEELERVKAIVERCARAAALASDVEYVSSVRQGYRDMVNNMTLARAFGTHLEALGQRSRETDPNVGTGSTDMGDVSHMVPAIHPWLAIVDEGTATCHQEAFAEAAVAPRGFDMALVAAKAMARTAIELLVNSELRTKVKAEWQAAPCASIPSRSIAPPRT